MRILGIKVDNITLQQAVGLVEEWLEGKEQGVFTVVTPNPEIIVQAQDDVRLKKIINSADLSVPDGVGLRLGGAGHTVPGVTLMEELCRVAAEKGWTVGLYGGRRGVAGEALERLQQKYPGLKGWSRTPPELGTEFGKLDDYVLGKLTKTRLLFVGLGAPKQEFVMDELLKAQGSRLKEKSKKIQKTPNPEPRTPNLILMAVGGAFDEISGRVRPAPAPARGLGFTWLWRLLQQPWRLTRQLRLPLFAWLVLRQRYFRRGIYERV